MKIKNAVITGGASGMGEAMVIAENAYINGECIRIDGGIRMQPR